MNQPLRVNKNIRLNVFVLRLDYFFSKNKNFETKRRFCLFSSKKMNWEVDLSQKHDNRNHYWNLKNSNYLITETENSF